MDKELGEVRTWCMLPFIDAAISLVVSPAIDSMSMLCQRVSELCQCRRDTWLSRVKYAHQLSDQNWRYSALKYVGFNPADQFTFS